MDGIASRGVLDFTKPTAMQYRLVLFIEVVAEDNSQVVMDQFVRRGNSLDVVNVNRMKRVRRAQISDDETVSRSST